MALILYEKDVERLLTIEEAIGVVEAAFRTVESGEATNFPRQRSVTQTVTLNVLPAVSNALDAAAIKCYPIVRSDITVGSNFTLLVYRISTGALLGIVEAGALGQIRTGAASAVATRYMARPDSRVVTLFGSGYQAESQLIAMNCVLPKLSKVNVVGRSAERASQFCARISARLECDIAVASDVRSAVLEADVVVTATGSHVPLFDGSWLRPGVHINAIGSNFLDKQEIDVTTVLRSDRVVADDVAVARIESGDLIKAVSEGGLGWDTVVTLADVVAGVVPGRVAPDDITLFESQGIGLEDLAVACHVLDAARKQGLGVEVELR